MHQKLIGIVFYKCANKYRISRNATSYFLAQSGQYRQMDGHFPKTKRLAVADRFCPQNW